MCCVFFSSSKAQIEQSVIVDKINTKDLTNSFVSSLFQDQKGYIWIGTIGGLNKYNGYNFTKYRCFPDDTTTLSNPSITSFHQTDEDEIFIGTRKGLNIYNYNNNNFKRIGLNKNLNNIIQKNNIKSIVTNNLLEKIIGTEDGILIYNQKTKNLEQLKYGQQSLLEGWSIHSMCIDRLGNLWVGAKKNDRNSPIKRVFKYNFSTAKLIEITADNSNSGEHSGISEDYLGNIWVAVDDGLVSINPGNYKLTFYKAPENFYSSVSFTHTKDNVIWQCYWSFGLTSFDIDKKEFKVYKNDPDNQKSLMSNKCWALYKDDNDILWIGCDVGLQKITSKRPRIEIIKRNNLKEKSSFKGNIITSVLASRVQNSVVFAGIDGEGFSIYNRIKQQSLNFGPNSEIKNEERFVNQFIEETNGDLFILGQNNFQKVSFASGTPIAKSFFNYQEHYSACGIQDPRDPNKLWVGGKGEIFSYDKKNNQFTFLKNPLDITDVFYSAFVAKGQIYFSYKNGLIKINPETKISEKIELPDVGNIKSAVTVNNNLIILASQYYGVIKFFPSTNKFEIIHKSKNEFFSEPSCILLYKNNLWLTTNDGLLSWNHLTGEISEISADDGLPSGIIRKTDVLDGYLYLASQEGLVIINPDFQMSHFITPKIDVTEFLILADNKTLGGLKNGAEIILTEKQNSFKINFTVLDFNLPEKNRFKFRLSPIENEWQAPAGENFLIFNSLAAGNYKFELLGANSDKIWSVEPFILNIKIVPPFYKSSWFYYLSISILILSSITFFYWRLHSNKLKQLMLEKVIRERTAEIQHQKAELMDSIIYAERIQKAIFVGENILKTNIPESFIYYKPKDKVSGDFYWIGKYKDLLIVFAGDCTGHGVPGAMLSIVGTSLLNKIVHEENIYLPGEILTRLNYLFYEQLSLNTDNVRDGMDASVITINVVNKLTYYSGAKLDAICIENNTLVDLKAQRHSIGESPNTEFITQSIPYLENRLFYLFSDGVKDQYGGPNKKKLSTKRFKEILQNSSVLPFIEQKQFINESIKSWKKDVPQTDDMIIIGLKF